MKTTGRVNGIISNIVIVKADGLSARTKSVTFTAGIPR